MWFDLAAPQDIVAVVLASLATTVLALYVLAKLASRHEKKQVSAARPDAVFLFEDGRLIDTAGSGNAIYEMTPVGGRDLERVTGFLGPRFPDLPALVRGGSDADASKTPPDGAGDKPGERPVGLSGISDAALRPGLPAENFRLNFVDNPSRGPAEQASETKLMAADGQGYLLISRTGRAIRLSLFVAEAAGAGATDPLITGSLLDNLNMHRSATDGVALPMWRQSADGTVTWSNAEYRRLEAIIAEKTGKEPGKTNIFAGQLDTGGDKRRVQRAKLELPGQAEPAWFEFQLTWHGDDLMAVAMPVDRVVQAERSLSGFVQTLTQTFAHLNVGLAVFNRNRELAIFNPALTELFDLSPEFLVTRPTLFQVFDRLRDQRMVPEMKDYKAWRGKLSALEAAASDKDYSETWSLVDGRTFRVTGRPHPEGAVAFLFEDISEEIGLERKFRADVQLGHAVLDAVDEAVAVFTPSGALALSNRAYRRLWMGETEEGELPINFVESTRLWQHNSMPTPVWGDARDFAATMTERSSWSAEVHLSDGRALHCRFDALSGGYTLAGFADLDARAAPPLAPPKAASGEQQQRLSA